MFSAVLNMQSIIVDKLLEKIFQGFSASNFSRFFFSLGTATATLSIMGIIRLTQ